MSLSSDLISQFVKATNDTSKTKTESTVYGTVVYDGKPYVKLDGSDLLTPVTTAADVKDGERVTVLIKDHTATVTGNLTSPAARTDDVKDVANQITDFEIVMAHKVTTEEIEALTATIESLRAKIAVFDNVEAIYAEIDRLEASLINAGHISATDMEVINAQIENLEVMFGKFTDISTEDLEAINADIKRLKAYTAEFTYVSAEVLEAYKAYIDDLNVKKLSVEDADIRYANIDFTNIGSAAIEYFYAKSGLIEDVVIGDGTITGNLVGVTIKGDLIEGGTVVADKLVIKGDDGLYYKLNTDGVTTEAEQTEYNSLDGSVITAKSITATKISVKDLVAFDATIGGFTISDKAIYSGVKSSAENTTLGIYMDSDGQLVVGDSGNFIKYYKDAEGSYKLAISVVDEVEDRLNQTISDKETSILATSEDIILSALQTYVQNGDYEEFKETVEAQLKIMSDEITMSFTNATTRIDEVDENLEEKIGEIYKHFSFSENGLAISSGDNEMSIRIDNDIVAFEKNGVQFGWWDGINFHTGNIMIDTTERAQFGNFAFVPRSDGSLSFLKVDDNAGFYVRLSGGIMRIYGSYPTLADNTLVIEDVAGALDGTTLTLGG